MRYASGAFQSSPLMSGPGESEPQGERRQREPDQRQDDSEAHVLRVHSTTEPTASWHEGGGTNLSAVVQHRQQQNHSHRDTVGHDQRFRHQFAPRVEQHDQ